MSWTHYNASLYWAQESLERRDHLLTALSSTHNLQKAPTECVVRQFWEASQIAWFCSAYNGIGRNCQQLVCSPASFTLRNMFCVHFQSLCPWPPAFTLQRVNLHPIYRSKGKKIGYISNVFRRFLKNFFYEIVRILCDNVRNKNNMWSLKMQTQVNTSLAIIWITHNHMWENDPTRGNLIRRARIWKMWKNARFWKWTNNA